MTDFRAGLFALTVRQSTFLTPSMIRRALQGGYQLARLEIEMQGTIEERRNTYWFKPAGHDRTMIQLGPRDLPPERRQEALAPLRALDEALEAGRTTFVVKGEVREDERRRTVTILLEEARPAEPALPPPPEE